MVNQIPTEQIIRRAALQFTDDIVHLPHTELSLLEYKFCILVRFITSWVTIIIKVLCYKSQNENLFLCFGKSVWIKQEFHLIHIQA